jgi:AraC-like DNA-binding protein
MIYKWLLAVSVFVLLTGLYYFIGNYVYFRSPSLERELVSNYRELYFIGGLLTCIPSLVLAFPELLYGIPRSREARNGLHTLSVSPASSLETDGAASPGDPDAWTDRSQLPMTAEDDPFRELGQRVLDFMEREKPYLNPNFSIEDLAEMLGVPKHHLYYCFKNVLKTKFLNLRNHFRVEEVKRRLLEADIKDIKLAAIGRECGFSSQSAFYRIFSEEVGCSPGEYMEQQTRPG